MGLIFAICGRSATGKDTIFQRVMEKLPELKPLITYTTRPMRSGEEDGVQYHFITDEDLIDFYERGLVIEDRAYKRIDDIVHYCTIKDEQFDEGGSDLCVVCALDQCTEYIEKFGKKVVKPIYLSVGEYDMLRRAIDREYRGKNPNYREVCRRFLAESDCYTDKSICAAGITDVNTFRNDVLANTVNDITGYIRMIRKRSHSSAKEVESYGKVQ